MGNLNIILCKLAPVKFEWNHRWPSYTGFTVHCKVDKIRICLLWFSNDAFNLARWSPDKADQLITFHRIRYQKELEVHWNSLNKTSNAVGSDILKCILYMSLMAARPDMDTQYSRQCVNSISIDCGRCYIGNVGRLLGVCMYKGIWK
jgi:hypothetical protein